MSRSECCRYVMEFSAAFRRHVMVLYCLDSCSTAFLYMLLTLTRCQRTNFKCVVIFADFRRCNIHS